jgi:hypothetical protein
MLFVTENTFQDRTTFTASPSETTSQIIVMVCMENNSRWISCSIICKIHFINIEILNVVVPEATSRVGFYLDLIHCIYYTGHMQGYYK